jgi:hypothetical protein
MTKLLEVDYYNRCRNNHILIRAERVPFPTVGMTIDFIDTIQGFSGRGHVVEIGSKTGLVHLKENLTATEDTELES